MFKTLNGLNSSNKSSKFLKCYKIQIMSNHNPKILIHMIQNDAIISKDFKLVLNPYDAIWYNHINLCQTCLDIFWCFYENGRTKRKMQGRKGKCKDDIKSYSLDRFEQVERSKTTKLGIQNSKGCFFRTSAP